MVCVDVVQLHDTSPFGVYMGFFFVLPAFFVFFGLGLIWAASPLYHNDFFWF